MRGCKAGSDATEGQVPRAGIDSQRSGSAPHNTLSGEGDRVRGEAAHEAIDRMLDIVDALQADFTDCTEGLVTLASVVLLRYLKVAAVDRHKIDLVAHACSASRRS